MTALEAAPMQHPLQPVAECLETIADALDRAPSGQLPSADSDVLELLVTESARVERQLSELRLRLALAAEEGRAEQADAASDTGAWLARLTGSTAAVMRGGLWLARKLEERYPAVRRAFASGDIGEAHARIIVRTAEAMPRVVTDADREQAVQALVDEAVDRRMNTKTLRRRARRMLDIVDRAYADVHEAALLEDEAHGAANDTWLQLQDNYNGTWSGQFVIPEMQAHMLLTHLQHLSSPRRMSRNKAGESVTDLTLPSFPGLGWLDSMGQAFLELCEHLPTEGLSKHGRVGATIAIHLDHERLLDGLGSARLDSGAEVTVGEVRRLACGAGIIPVVYGKASVPLDLGREARLHTKAQRIALSGLHDTCAAEGCERPFAWTEVHHPEPWARGGRTDLANAVPLCGWHHRRAHDETYDMRRLASGEVRIRRRP